MKTIASNLLVLRDEKGFTQKFMAIQSGMSQANYSDIERGKRNPSIAQLMRFSEILGARIDSLMQENETTESEDDHGYDQNDNRQLLEFLKIIADKDVYIKILEGQLRRLLEKSA